MREFTRESRLLASIATRSIRQPLEGVDTPHGRFLLNGFKRLRCARQLSLGCVPYVSIADQEATGITHLMCVERDHRLNLLEQAKFVVELLKIHGMSVAEVSETLSRSKSWVSMRQDLLKEMSQDSCTRHVPGQSTSGRSPHRDATGSMGCRKSKTSSGASN